MNRLLTFESRKPARVRTSGVAADGLCITAEEKMLDRFNELQARQALTRLS